MSEVIVASGNIATVEDALADPGAYEVTRDWLGWKLREGRSSFSTMISAADARRVLDAMDAMEVEMEEGR